MSQTCPNYRGGYTSQNMLQSSQELGIYVNTSPGDLIPCDGTVYAWHYCYYRGNNGGSGRSDPNAVFAVYYLDDSSEHYLMRPGSFYPLHLDMRESSFTCGTVSLTETEQFQVYAGDSTGVCLSETSPERNHQLNVIASYSSGDAVHWSSPSQRCARTDIEISDEDFLTNRPFVVHLFVDISKNNLCPTSLLLFISYRY